MGHFEFIATRFFFVSKFALASPYIHRLRSAASYLLLLILSSVQLANAYRDNYNQGISYAAFIGSLLTFFKNLAIAEDKASSFDDSLREHDSRELPGWRHLGLLSSIIKIPIRLERISTFALASKAIDFSLTYFSSFPCYAKPFLFIVKFLVVSVTGSISLSLNIIGILLIPLSILLLLIDILSIPFVETILVAFAENLPWIPELRGVIWGYVSLSLTVLAIASAFCRDYLAWLAWLRDNRAFHVMGDRDMHDVDPNQALRLIRAVPSSHETALAAAINLAENRDWHGSDSAVHFSHVIAADTKSNVCCLGIEFSSPQHDTRFHLVKVDSLLERRPPRKILHDTKIEVWPPDVEESGTESGSSTKA